MTLLQGFKYMIAWYCKPCDDNRKASTVQTILGKYFTENKAVILNVSNVLNYSVLNRY